MKIKLMQAISGLDFNLKATDVVDTAVKDCPISTNDAKRMIDRGIAVEMPSDRKKAK
ncbi:MAG: hypothetical protein ACI9T9_000757 [Oleiphilaceae bacterium]|jgi:hypothetical protein